MASVLLYAGCMFFFVIVVVSKDVASQNETEVAGRSSRKYTDTSLPVTIPVGFFTSPDAPTYMDASTDKQSDTSSKYSLPTSFDEFVPSGQAQQPGKKPRYNYPQYYIAKGAPVKGVPPPMAPTSWKGDAGDDDSSAPWMPNPTDMVMMMNMIKGMNGDTTDDGDDMPTGFLAKLQAEPIAVVLALLIPFTILLAAVIPTLGALLMNFGMEMNIPTITTVATGNSGRKMRSGDDPSMVAPILEAIETFKSSSGSICIQKAFCKATGGKDGTEYRPIQKNIYKAFTFVDDYWLETLGVKQLMEAMGSGDCEKIKCAEESIKHSSNLQQHKEKKV